ncbi:amino acid ABC transporter permease [Rhizobium multihospitium]|uniref:Amino acid ABC transporter membrane protein 2, PAAT family (TC 3.A.1.3.-) n=1 Tax=Rhizobium multihospitium TaxID=410764 RepID=A0A1C3VWS9_9HYPH|nr:amino acid ABC transporter permease [Rhizobium multihospitium]SCB32202.1 amino acid ABC transporter membrane protein 2, PAAT family (TC 3.A.1.3.-) [Rhizobium multihospitium]
MQFSFANQGLVWSDAYFLAEGLFNTIRLAASATFVGTLVGIALGWLRTVSLTARIVTAPYIDILRSVPMIIQLILANSFLSILGFGASPFWFGTIALGAWMSAVTAEVVRAGLLSVPVQYRRSARSLGMNGLQELLYISMPLAFRTALTPWIGLVLSLIKDSALAGVVGYVEYMRSTQILITRTHETWLLLIGAGLFYFIICYPVSRYSRRLEGRIVV